MRVKNLLGIGKRSIESLSDNGKVLRHLFIVDERALLPVILGDLLVERVVRDGGHATQSHWDGCPTLSSSENSSSCQHCGVVLLGRGDGEGREERARASRAEDEGRR